MSESESESKTRKSVRFADQAVKTTYCAEEGGRFLARYRDATKTTSDHNVPPRIGREPVVVFDISTPAELRRARDGEYGHLLGGASEHRLPMKVQITVSGSVLYVGREADGKKWSLWL